MKTTLKYKFQAVADNARNLSHQALKRPVSSILSLCVVAGIAATIASFSQTSEPTVAVTPTAQTMPVARTLTSADGRTIDVVITAKTATAIVVKKADNKEFEIALDKLSAADKAFVAELAAHPTLSPIPFEKLKGYGWRFNYGNHILIRVKDQIFAFKADGIPSQKPIVYKGDNCIYAIKYKVVKFAKGPTGKTIVSKTVDAEGHPINCVIDFSEFKILWSPGGSTTGSLTFSKQTFGRSTKVGPPPETEYYNQQLPTLDSVASLDPKGWLPLP